MSDPYLDFVRNFSKKAGGVLGQLNFTNRAREIAGQPLLPQPAQQALETIGINPTNADLMLAGVESLPGIGDVSDMMDIKEGYQNDNYLQMGGGMLGAIPMFGGALKAAVPAVAAGIGGLATMHRLAGDQVSDMARMYPNQGGMVKAYHGTPKELYDNSQQSWSLAKKAGADDFKKSISDLRSDRWNAQQTVNVTPLNNRLYDYKAEKQGLTPYEAKSLDDINSSFWNKNELNEIKKEASMGMDGSVGFAKKKANLKAATRQLKKQGWEIKHTSKNNNRVSTYYAIKDGRTIRLSDHDLPDTPQRQHNRSMGLTGSWDEEILIDSKTDLNSLLKEIK